MTTITQIDADEVIEALAAHGVHCDELWFEGPKWSYADGFLEGESKWCLLLCANADSQFSAADSLGAFSNRGRRCVPPLAAVEYLACVGYLPKGDYLVWRAW